jgi:hypothetical protein
MWSASGRVVNPALDQVLVDTGALPAGVRSVQAVVSATANCAAELQHRNSTNTATIKSQILAVPGFGTAILPPLFPDLSMADNERVRIIAVAAVVGSVSASLDIA